MTEKQYPKLPAPDTHCFDEDTGEDVWSHSADQMRAYVDADRAMRAANAKPVAWRRPRYREWEYEDGITSFEYDPSAQALYTEPQATPASQDAEDAARYRYLKKYKAWDSTDVFYWLRCAPADEVDSVIDAARAAKEGGA